MNKGPSHSILGSTYAEQGQNSRSIPGRTSCGQAGGAFKGAWRNPQAPAERLLRADVLRDDWLRGAAPPLPGRLSLRSQAAVAVRLAGFTEELHGDLPDDGLPESRDGALVARSVPGARQEAGHGKELHPLQETRGPSAGRSR